MYKAFVPLGLLFAGCGLSDDLGLGELSEKQQTKLCEELADFEPVTLTCDSVMLTFDPTPVAECESDLASIPAGCTATVGDQLACIDAVQEITCESDLTDGPCAAIFHESCIQAIAG